MSATDPVVIVGGGISGLAAGVELTSHGIPVTLLEQKPGLGGRASSFRDSVTGETVDNGQHVLIAGYKRTFRFLDTIGSLSHLRVQHRLALTFHEYGRGFTSVRLPSLPSPFNLLAGVLSSSHFSLSDKIRMIRAGIALRRRDVESSMTIDEWLDETDQSPDTRRRFWEPLAVSIMNEHTAVASAPTFLRSLQAAFFQGGKAAAVAIPTVGLTQLYADQAAEFITAHGGRIRCNKDVTAVALSDGQVTGVRLRDGEEVPCSGVIAAVPPYRVTSLLGSDLPELAFPDFEASPIVSVHLWFSEDPMQHEFVALVGRSVQWVFNRRRITGSTAPGGHLSAVISAARDFVDLSNAELISLAAGDIRTAYPIGDPMHALVVREKRATYRPRPGTELRRPPQATRIPNLTIAGDWTDTGFPATIEGAVISGERCAEIIRQWRSA